MKKMMMKSFAVLIMLGAFSLVSFAQTTLQLNSDDTASASSQPGPGQTVDFNISLAKDTYVCANAKSKLATWSATFDGKNVTSTESCFEITATRSYSIKLANKSTSTGAFTPFSVTMDLSSSTLLRMVEGNTTSKGMLLPKQENKVFNVKLEAGKTVCMAASSSDLSGFTVTFDNTNVPVTADQNSPTCLTGTTTAKYYKIKLSNRTTKGFKFDLRIGYQQ